MFTQFGHLVLLQAAVRLLLVSATLLILLFETALRYLVQRLATREPHSARPVPLCNSSDAFVSQKCSVFPFDHVVILGPFVFGGRGHAHGVIVVELLGTLVGVKLPDVDHLWICVADNSDHMGLKVELRRPQLKFSVRRRESLGTVLKDDWCALQAHDISNCRGN